MSAGLSALGYASPLRPCGAVAIDDRPDDQRIRTETDQIEDRLVLRRAAVDRDQKTAQSIERERRGEEQEETLAARAPEAGKEQARDQRGHSDRDEQGLIHCRSLPVPDQAVQQQEHAGEGRYQSPG